MKWLVNTVSSFFVGPEAYLNKCKENYQSMSKTELYKYTKTAASVGAVSGLGTYIISGVISGADPNLGLVTGITVGGLYLANKVYTLDR